MHDIQVFEYHAYVSPYEWSGTMSSKHEIWIEQNGWFKLNGSVFSVSFSLKIVFCNVDPKDMLSCLEIWKFPMEWAC